MCFERSKISSKRTVIDNISKNVHINNSWWILETAFASVLLKITYCIRFQDFMAVHCYRVFSLWVMVWRRSRRLHENNENVRNVGSTTCLSTVPWHTNMIHSTLYVEGNKNLHRNVGRCRFRYPILNLWSILENVVIKFSYFSANGTAETT